MSICSEHYEQVMKNVMSWPLWKRIVASQDLPVHSKPFYTIDEYNEYVGKKKFDEFLNNIKDLSVGERIALSEYIQHHFQPLYTVEEYQQYVRENF